MYPRMKPKNLHISVYEGVDMTGKTTAINTAKQAIIKHGFTSTIIKNAVNNMTSKYENPLLIEGTPLYDEFIIFMKQSLANSGDFFQDELLSAYGSDFHVADSYGSTIRLFLTLPHKGVPSYSVIKRILSSSDEIPSKRIETRFKAFVTNYHEAMNQYVFPFIKKHRKNNFLLTCDRSWVSNFVYNWSAVASSDDELETRIRNAGYHQIDMLTLCIISPEALEKRLKSRMPESLSVYEKYGLMPLLKFQEKYIYLVNKLYNLGFIKEYIILENFKHCFDGKS